MPGKVHGDVVKKSYGEDGARGGGALVPGMQRGLQKDAVRDGPVAADVGGERRLVRAKHEDPVPGERAVHGLQRGACVAESLAISGVQKGCEAGVDFFGQLVEASY